MSKNKCKVCSKITLNGFNIDFKLVPICEDCANAITIQQVKWLTFNNKEETKKIDNLEK